MERVRSYAPNQKVRSADLNDWQDQGASLFQIAWTWLGRRPGLACDGSNLTVGQHHGCAAGTEQADAQRIPELGEQIINLVGLTLDTWYFLYAYRDEDGECAYEWDTTPPDDAGTYHPNDLTRSYVGFFRALSPTTARPFTMRNGRYIMPADADLTAALVSESDTAWTDLSLAEYMPVHTRVVRLRALVTGTAGQYASVRPNGSSLNGRYVYAGVSDVSLETDSMQKVEYKNVDSTALTLYVTEVEE